MTNPIAGQTYSVSLTVEDAASAGVAKTDPTIDAANDFLISINGGGWDTLDNDPVVSPSGSEFIDITLSAAETTAAGAGGYIKLRWADATGTEWIGGADRLNVVAAATSTLTAAQVNAEVDTAITDAALATAASLATVASYIDTEVAAIKAKTDNLPVAPASTGDIAAALATYDAATSAELTATQVAIQADIEALNVIPAAASSSGNVSGVLQIIRASTFSATLTGIVAPADWVAARFTVKESGTITQVDTASVIQILVTNPGDAEADGLIVLSGAAGDLVGGSISINTDDDEVDIALDDDTTAQLTTGTYSYDVKFYYGTSESGPPYTGTLTVSATPTQTIIPRA